MRLLLLHDDVKNWLRVGKIEMGHARALLSLDSDAQLTLALKIIENGLSVRDAEKLVQKMKMPAPSYSESTVSVSEEKIAAWTRTLSERLSSNVRIQFNSKGEGRVVIHVNSSEEIEWLIENLKDKNA